MIYKNLEMKIDQLVNYLNNDKINLSPAFQRGHVWKAKQRQKLIKNMVDGKPIPAIFLYKEESGAKYSYNILDGKQRIESIILFIGCSRDDELNLKNWTRYFSDRVHRKDINFCIDFGGKKTITDLDDTTIRNFKEYVLPTIEIALDDSTSLDEIISLFVDINQQGVEVKRFDIVKAMYRDDHFLKQIFKLIAEKQKRKHDIYYKMINNEFTFVIKRLSTIDKSREANIKIDKMWERLLEISLFTITKTHRKPVDILKEFISKKTKSSYKLSKVHIKEMRKIFSFLKQAYSDSKELIMSKLVTDATHFYTMITTLINSDLLSRFDAQELKTRLVKFASILDQKSTKLSDANVAEYMELSSKHTTDVKRREKRAELFYTIILALN